MSRRGWWARLRAWAVSATPAQDSDEAENGRKILSTDLWSFGIGAAVAGYLAADYLAFFSPVARAAAGLSFILMFTMVHRGLSTHIRWKRIAWLAPVVVALAATLVTSQSFIIRTTDAAEAAEVRCAHIQHEMLMAHPRRADLPDIFAALGCHASGREDIAFPGAAGRQTPSVSVQATQGNVAAPRQ